MFIKDSSGRITQEPDHMFSHTNDAVRYAITSLMRIPEPSHDDEMRVLTNRVARLSNDFGV